MKLKSKITKLVAEKLSLESNDKNLKKLKMLWWQNPRIKDTGGLRLTEEGFESLKKADIKCHKIKLENPVALTNQLTIWLDNFIDCPWYLTKKEIYVFGEKTAIVLVLFSGDIAKFSAAKAGQIKVLDKS